MKRILAAAVLTAAMAAPAYSQMNMKGGSTPADQLRENQRVEREFNEQKYNETMKRLKQQPPAETKSDPWAGVRPAPEANSKR
jgi:hypothetical protein